jgi:L-arabinose isomerase
MADFAHMLHTELLVIDQDTSSAQFADRIRWNQAYYRLAQGLPGGPG